MGWTERNGTGKLAGNKVTNNINLFCITRIIFGLRVPQAYVNIPYCSKSRNMKLQGLDNSTMKKLSTQTKMKIKWAIK